MKKFFYALFLIIIIPLGAEERNLLLPKSFHDEVKEIIEAEIKAPIEYSALTIDEFNSTSLFFPDIFRYGESTPFSDEEKKDFLISLPYTWDYGVIISRKEDNGMLTTKSKLREKKYITISGIFSIEKYMIANRQKISYNITTITNPFNSFSKIFKGEADFTILPSNIAEKLLQSTGMKTELAVSGSPDDTIMKMHYRFAVKSEDKDLLIKINDVIDSLYQSGKLQEIAEKNNVPPPFAPSYYEPTVPQRQTMITVLNITVVSMTVCIFLISLIIHKSTKKKRIKKNGPSQENTLAQLELKRQVEEYLQGKVTLTEQTLKDPYSGLFSMAYFKDRVLEEISRHNNFDQDFCVAVMKFKDVPAITEKMVKDAAAMVQEDFNQDCICSYNGDGAFLVLFPKRAKLDVQIFAEGAEEHLMRVTNCEFETEVFQYGTMKQNEFMERICVR